MNRETKHFLLRLPLTILDLAQESKVHCVQVGANDGEMADPLYPFLSERGWSGVLLEPNPIYFKRLKARHEGRDDIKLLNVAASDQDGEMVLHYLSEDHEALYRENARGCASFDRDRMLAGLLKERNDAEQHLAQAHVPIRPLRDILADQNVTRTDVLVIDTEGHEPQVLAGADLAVLKPKVAIVELNDRRHKGGVLGPFLDQGYRCYKHMQEIIAISPEAPQLSIGDVLGAAGVRSFSSV